MYVGVLLFVLLLLILLCPLVLVYIYLLYTTNVFFFLSVVTLICFKCPPEYSCCLLKSAEWH